MVGVKGKFIGCNTCRTRRVKCGNERPNCTKCINSGRDCGGYERDRIFIVGTPDEHGRCSSHPHRSGLMHKIKNKVSGAKPGRSGNLLQSSNPLDPLGGVSNGPANFIQFLALNTNMLSLASVYEPNDGSMTFPPLMTCLPQLAQSSPALEYALRALCLIHTGVTNKNPALIKESALLNTQAMAKVRLATININSATKIETLAASMCLYLYEQLACTMEKGAAWRILFQGSSLLVRQRGPASYKSQPDHHFFVRLFRNDACFDALTRSKKTWLAEPEWCTVPWENIQKSDMDRLFDIEVLLPEIFERQAQLQKHPPSVQRRNSARQLLELCFQIEKKFENWYNNLHAKAKKPLFWSIPRQMHKEGPVKKLGFDMCFLFSTYLQFIDLNSAFLHMYYWAALGLFYRKIQHLHRLSNEGAAEQTASMPYFNIQETHMFMPTSSDALRQCQANAHNTSFSPTGSPFSNEDTFSPQNALWSLPPPTTICRQALAPISLCENESPPLDPQYSEASVLCLCTLICQSLPFTLNRTLHSIGPNPSAWPIWSAMQVFKRQGHQAEIEWCTKMMQMWDREGWKFGFQMGRVDWQD